MRREGVSGKIISGATTIGLNGMGSLARFFLQTTPDKREAAYNRTKQKTIHQPSNAKKAKEGAFSCV